MVILTLSCAAILTGYLLDMIFGDPKGFPHIVRLMGRFIKMLEKILRRLLPATAAGQKSGGLILVLATVAVFFALPFALVFLSYLIHPVLGYITESFLCFQLLAAKSLKKESMKVYQSLVEKDIKGARKNVSMIVGRDTTDLFESGIICAAVETIAENSSDGVCAPLFYIMLGGAGAGCLYKAVNTIDSMVGYKNEMYIHFGCAGAKTDDVFNYIPSRICALITIGAAYALRLDGKSALRIWRRDRRKHTSPNAAQTEAVYAGALGIKLAGPSSYFGKIYDKPYIGDETRMLKPQDIVLANRLMYVSSVFMLVAAVLFRITIMGVILL